MEKLWTDDAWNDYIYWQEQDKKQKTLPIVGKVLLLRRLSPIMTEYINIRFT